MRAVGHCCLSVLKTISVGLTGDGGGSRANDARSNEFWVLVDRHLSLGRNGRQLSATPRCVRLARRGTVLRTVGRRSATLQIAAGAVGSVSVERDHRQFAHELRTLGIGSVVVPADEPAEHSPDDRCDVPVAPLVLGQYGCCLRGIQLAVRGSEALTADRKPRRRCLRRGCDTTAPYVRVRRGRSPRERAGFSPMTSSIV